MTYQDLINDIILLIPDNTARRVTPASVREALGKIIDYINEQATGVPFIKSTFTDETTILDDRLLHKGVAFLYAPSENMIITDVTHSTDTNYLQLNSGSRSVGDLVYVVFALEKEPDYQVFSEQFTPQFA